MKKKLFRFSDFFFDYHKKRHISKRTVIWIVIVGGKICNSFEYSDSTNYGVGNFKFWKNNELKFSEIFLKKPQKTSHLENYNYLSCQIWR